MRANCPLDVVLPQWKRRVFPVFLQGSCFFELWLASSNCRCSFTLSVIGDEPRQNISVRPEKRVRLSQRCCHRRHPRPLNPRAKLRYVITIVSKLESLFCIYSSTPTDRPGSTHRPRPPTTLARRRRTRSHAHCSSCVWFLRVHFPWG